MAKEQLLNMTDEEDEQMAEQEWEAGKKPLVEMADDELDTLCKNIIATNGRVTAEQTEDDGGDMAEYLPPLEPSERDRLSELETVIQKNLQAFYEVGMALREIRDLKLYRDAFITWDEYCRDKWDMSRSYAHRLVDSSQIIQNLLPIGNIPQNEAQVRPLTRVEGPEKQKEIWEKVMVAAQNEGKKVTAKLVESIVRAECPLTRAPKSAKQKAGTAADGGIPDVTFWPDDVDTPAIPPAIDNPWQALLRELVRMKQENVSLGKDARTYLKYQAYELKVVLDGM